MRIVQQFDDYTIEQGWSDDLADELVHASREPNIQKYTPNDTLRRFKDVDAAQTWYNNPEKLPIVYALRDNLHRQLGGIAWFSRGQNDALDPSYRTTFAIRLYETSQGQGLSYPFAKAAHDDFTSLPTHNSMQHIWLDTGRDNLPAQKLYQKLGYRVLAVTENRIVMGLHTDD